MEDDSKQPISKNTSNNHNPNESIGDQAFKSAGDLIKLLPTGTVFLFQFLSPLLTNAGHCSTPNKVLSSILLFCCGFTCCFSSFTDSYIGCDGKLYYGVATITGLCSFSDPNAGSLDLSKYKLRIGDFAHAFLALVVFAAIALLLDANMVSCFYRSLDSEKGRVLVVGVMPVMVIGVLASSVFMLFPNNRHGIGYPPTQPTEDFQPK